MYRDQGNPVSPATAGTIPINKIGAGKLKSSFIQMTDDPTPDCTNQSAADESHIINSLSTRNVSGKERMERIKMREIKQQHHDYVERCQPSIAPGIRTGEIVGIQVGDQRDGKGQEEERPAPVDDLEQQEKHN
ncbi:MAG: hypothetical protein WCS62_05610 [Bacilli bacterium]